VSDPSWRDYEPSHHWLAHDAELEAEELDRTLAHHRRLDAADRFEAELVAQRDDPAATARAAWWQELKRLDDEQRAARLAGLDAEARRLRAVFRQTFATGPASPQERTQ
jgi:hypothetical protein